MIDILDMAPTPPPPPLEDDPPPLPPEEEPPPELDTPPPPITLEQINMSLEPGIGSSLSGDFALPTFDVDAKSLGGLDIFDISEHRAYQDLLGVPTMQRSGKVVHTMWKALSSVRARHRWGRLMSEMTTLEHALVRTYGSN